jgi:hypothetical protein
VTRPQLFSGASPLRDSFTEEQEPRARVPCLGAAGSDRQGRTVHGLIEQAQALPFSAQASRSDLNLEAHRLEGSARGGRPIHARVVALPAKPWDAASHRCGDAPLTVRWQAMWVFSRSADIYDAALSSAREAGPHTSPAGCQPRTGSRCPVSPCLTGSGRRGN